MTAPQLERHCGSWVIVSKETGKPVYETFSKKTADEIDTVKYEVLTALQWLCRFNNMTKGR